MSRQKADLILAVVSALWGSSYLFMKIGIESLATFNLIALRFLLAFVVTLLFFGWRLIQRTDRRSLWYSFLLSLILLAVFSSILIGLHATSASKAGFLLALTVVFVPLLNGIFFRVLPEPKMIAGVLLALIGIGLLTWNGGLSLESGDAFCMLGALANALYFLLADRFTKREDPVTLGVWQMGMTGALGLLISLIFEIPHLPSTPSSWFAVAGLGILCSAAGYTLQNIAQKYTLSTHAGLIFSLEPVFAAFFAFAFFGEVLPSRSYLGAGLVLISVVLMELPLKKRAYPGRLRQHQAR
ncbi:DMT family transporter [Sporolactobacillus vineae]|uniref:DMT family transporter n=1 Tax=Sporolactobacillus vineae TaxID=444463 RepID=UPI000288D42E|nr:DMT family transporter [Sporolactobacillus vineae]